jgi:acyl-homoserine lactone acylase PvdQ
VSRISPIALVLAGAALALAAPSAAHDYAGTALNIIPSGQYGSVPVPAGADRQAKMYDGLTPLFNNVTIGDLTKYFKSEALGVNGPAPTSVEPTPRAGLKIVRDSFHVPHITGKTRDDATWGAGWVVAEDRALLLQFARGPAYTATVDPPGIDAFGLVKQVRAFTPSAQTKAFVGRETKLLLHSGPKGKRLLHDIDVFLQGINAQLTAQGSSQAPWTRTDIYAVNALLAQFLGQGGGDEARRSEFLNGLQTHLGAHRGLAVFNDLRERKDPETPYSLDGTFPYGQVPTHRTGNVVLDNGSLSPVAEAAARSMSQQMASNILMVAGRRSTNGHPLFVGGPQIGYFYPGLTLEMDVHAPGESWRGATSVPFPGYMLIGRGEDFANTLTSAHADIIDQFAERLCGDDTHYRYKGKCRKMGTFDAGKLGALGSDPAREVVFKTTVHGPVVGYATSHGRRVAISSKRSSRGREVLFQFAFQDLSLGKVHDPKSFFHAFAHVPLTFNAFYADSKHIAEYTAGRLPIRAKGVDPGLPTEGTGGHEWRGFLAPNAHPHGVDPKAGMLVNWNNLPARGFQTSDDRFAHGSVERDLLLLRGIAKRKKHDLASVTGAMNAAATQDVRSVEFTPILAAMLKTGAPNARDARMLKLLELWRQHGGSLLDRNLDGKVDDPGAAIMDEAWTGLANAVMTPVLGHGLVDQLATLFKRYDHPLDEQFDGWTGYMSKDLRSLLHMPVKGPYSQHYCGAGSPGKCRSALWAALDAAGNTLRAAQGPNPDAWRADATVEQRKFAPINLLTMRYTNRPSGIQQVITFTGHR